MQLGCSPHRDPLNGMGYQDTSNGMALNDQLEFLHPTRPKRLGMHSGIPSQEAISTQTHEIEYLGGFPSLIVLKIMPSVNQGTRLWI